jgi:SSS family solute:Na+ symporter
MGIGIIDFAIIGTYLLVCVGAGVWMKRYVHQVEDFALARREMDVYLGVASLAATELGVVTVMYTAQLGFTQGFAGATPGVLMAFWMGLVGATGFIIRPLRQAGVMTIPELFEKRFGVLVRWLAGLVVVLGGVLNMGIFLRLGGEFLVHTAGLPPEYLKWVMTGLLALVLLYTTLGGMISVLVTDYLQFIVMGTGIVVTSVFVLQEAGWNRLLGTLKEAYRETGMVSMVPGDQPVHAQEEFGVHSEKESAVGPSDRPSVPSAGPTGSLKMGNPVNPLGRGGPGWIWVLWQALVALAAITTWQTMVVRVLAAKDESTACAIYRRTAFYFVGRFALPGLWGAAAFAYFYRQGGLPDGVTDLTAMPTYLGQLLPAGILGLVIAGMLAAEMSTDSGYLLTWATVIYNDLVMPCLRRPLSPAGRLLLIRILVVAIGIFLVFWGLWYELPGTAWDYLAVTGTIYLASLFTLLVAALYFPGAARTGALAAIILGAVGPISFVILNALLPEGSPWRISAEVAGLSAFALAALGMILGSLSEHMFKALHGKK